MLSQAEASSWPTLFNRNSSNVTNPESLLIFGYANIYDTKDSLNDVFRPGAFRNSLERINNEGRSIKMLLNHDPSKVIGRWTVVEETDIGLYVEGIIDSPTPEAQEYIQLIKSEQIIKGLSVGYRVLSANKKDGLREILSAEIWEVSLTSNPSQSVAGYRIQDNESFSIMCEAYLLR